jgi:chromosome segregation ATPase
MDGYKTGEARVFVRIDDYKNVLSILELIKNKLEEAKSTLSEINELKNEENSELEMWGSTLDDIEAKLDTLDRTLFEPESAF